NSGSGPHSRRTQHNIHARQTQTATGTIHRGRTPHAGVCVSATIAVLGGTGPEGFGLARRWVQAGETVIIGSRDAKRAQDTAAKIKAAVGASARVSGEE